MFQSSLSQMITTTVRGKIPSKYQAIFLYLGSSVGEALVKPELDDNHNSEWENSLKKSGYTSLPGEQCW